MKNFFLLFLFLVSFSSAQDLPLLGIQNQKYNTSLEKLYQDRSIISHTVPQVLESELDEELYIVGPGDQFKISVFGELEKSFEFTVLPGGTALIPTVGEYKVSGLTLQEAKNKLLSEVNKNYIQADISVNLTGLRKFRVYFTGEVNAPGTYFAQGSDRLSDIVEISSIEKRNIQENSTGSSIASSISNWGDDTNILITRKDGTINHYDLSRFYRHGDINQNPMLAGGDIIFVPSIDLNQPFVIIEGNVGVQGVYPLKENENLFDFLTRVSALNKKSDLQNIVVEREGKAEQIDFLNNLEDYKAYFLKHNDKILIPTIYENVYVRGEVYSPGSFPYRANYIAKDYIGEPGALDSADDLDDVVIIRQSTHEVLNGADTIIEKGDTIILPKRTREVFKDYLSILAPIASILIATLALTR